MTNPSILNNTAVLQIQDGEYDTAISTLTKALRTVKLVMSGDAMIASHISDDDCKSSGLLSSRKFCCEFSSSGASSFLRTFEEGRICKSSVFRDPIHIRGAVPTSELERCEVISYAILYNLALTHHLESIDEPNQVLQRSLLHKSLALYEHAHHMLMKQDIDAPFLHTMALASNLGHTNHMLGDEERENLCFEYLLSTILYLVYYGEAEQINELDGFLTNIMPLISKDSSAPAA
jgi:hypothetical protein